ncbi:MAG: site-specific DNA-methyltransferase [Hyphomicrobiales bacterium]|nr:site-specific DNA-methyltransferase [Hyphomicrobiales bacterium]
MVESPPENQILHGDCIEVMASLPSDMADVIFADPPYNLQLAGELRRPNQSRVDGVEDAWDKFSGFDAYDRFTRAWLTEAKRLLKPDGSLWVIGSYHNIFRVGTILQDLGLWILNDVIWRKTNPMPNFRGRRFTNAHETLIWCAKSEGARYHFDYRAMKNLNDDLQMRSDWYIPICGGSERLRNDGRKAHSTQKPEALLHRVILASSQVDDLILDPFFGTGTSGAVAVKLGRRYLGIEANAQYLDLARERIKSVERTTDEGLLTSMSKRDAPRVPFGWIVERGWLQPGEILSDVRGRYAARVAADGTIAAGECRGSIHHVGAQVQNVPACNGWQFWYANLNGKPVPLDLLRQKLRAELH